MSNRDYSESVVKEILYDELRLNAEDIPSDMSLKEFGIKQSSLVNIISEIEFAFRIDIDYNIIKNHKDLKFSDLVDIIFEQFQLNDIGEQR